MLDQYYNLLDNNAKACYKFAENSLKKNGIKIICDERLFDQPLYQTIDGLSGIIAIKLHNSKNEVKKGIEQLKEYNKNIGTIYYYLSRGFPSVFLAQLYIDGKYVHQNYHQANDILENLLKYLLYSESAETKYLLGTMYQQGLGMKKT